MAAILAFDIEPLLGIPLMPHRGSWRGTLKQLIHRLALGAGLKNHQPLPVV